MGPVVHNPAVGPGTTSVTVGAGAFDRDLGELVRVGDLPVTGPRLDLWRAPTDNDEGYHGDQKWAPIWRRVGLHRLQHRVDDVAVEDGALVVRARVAPAATDLGVSATYRWTAVGGGLRLGAIDGTVTRMPDTAANRAAFGSAGPAETGYESGSGLGLELARHIAAGFGARIELAPRRPGGTRAMLAFGAV